MEESSTATWGTCMCGRKKSVHQRATGDSVLGDLLSVRAGDGGFQLEENFLCNWD